MSNKYDCMFTGIVKLLVFRISLCLLMCTKISTTDSAHEQCFEESSEDVKDADPDDE